MQGLVQQNVSSVKPFQAARTTADLTLLPAVNALALNKIYVETDV